MLLRDQQQIVKETNVVFNEALKRKGVGGKVKATRQQKREAKKEALEEMKKRYGASPDWAKIFKIVMTLLSLLAL